MSSKQRESSDKHYMQLALAAASQAFELGEVPIGALLVMNDEVVASAYNRSVADSDPVGHAEVLAIRQAAAKLQTSRLDGATLYVTIEPCTMCAGALLQARIERLVFGAREPRTGGVVSIAETLMNPANTHHVAVTEAVLAEQASEFMRRFFQSLR